MLSSRFPKHQLLLILLLCLIFCCFLHAREVSVEYFYQPNCQECREVNQLILPEIREELKGKFTFTEYDLSQEKNFLLLFSILEKFHDESNAHVYMVVNRKYLMGGSKAIQNNLRKVIQSEYEAARTDSASGKDSNAIVLPDEEKLKEKIRLGTVIAAGFLDGINPCVFITLIFFMSILSTAKVTRKRLALIGMIYISACFLTYLLLGLGLYQLLSFAFYLETLKQILNYGMVVILLFLAVLSFRDACRFLHSQNSNDISLQLPQGIKNIIHSLIRRLRRNAFMIPGIFILGTAVTLLESVCTGQVYVPTIMLLIRENGILTSWFFYLILYNLVFILPLCGIFLLVLSGTSVLSLASASRKQVVLSKILLTIFFLLLAFLLLYFQ